MVASTYKEVWESDGWCVTPSVIPRDDLAAAQNAVAKLFPTAEEWTRGS